MLKSRTMATQGTLARHSSLKAMMDNLEDVKNAIHCNQKMDLAVRHLTCKSNRGGSCKREVEATEKWILIFVDVPSIEFYRVL